MSRKLYKEKQRFLNRGYLYLLLALAASLAITIVIRGGLNPDISSGQSGLLPSLVVVSLISLALSFIFTLTIKLSLTPKGIEYKMTPFHKGKRVIPWNNISSIRIVRTPSNTVWQKDYNNYMLQDKFTFTGRNGISIKTRGGRILFIGSSNIDELKDAISKACRKFDLPQVNG